MIYEVAFASWVNFPEKSVITDINFEITPPIWKTLWFKLILFIILSISILSIYYARVNVLKNNQTRLEKQVKERTREIYNQKKELAVQTNILEKLNATKDRFFSIIAHDLRSPFQNILGTTSLLAKEYDNVPDNQKKELIINLAKSSESTYNLLENLLHWARSQTNRINIKTECLSLNNLISETFQILNPYAKKKNIKLISDVSENFIVYADKNIFFTVLRNLLTNAIKFSVPKSQVEITAKENNDMSIIEIKDYGTGMDENTLNKLFSIDKQISKQGTLGESGTGLGLIICQEFINKMNGKISVRSKPDLGSTFIIELPFSKDVTDKSFIKKDKETLSKTQLSNKNNTSFNLENNFKSYNKFSILIVDDDPSLRNSLSQFLKAFKIKEAINGKDAFVKTINSMPDLIVSDVVMPIMDGIDFCKKIKNDNRTNHIPVILLTANKEEVVKISALDSGADDFITKPFNAEMLIKRIQNLIDIRNSLKKKFQCQIDIKPNEITCNNKEEQFLQKAIKSVEDNLDNSDFNIDSLAQDIGMSRSLMYIKMKAITGQTANDFIKSIKLKKAAKMLTESELSINEISILVGFKNQSHFSRSFTGYFKISPIKYRNKKQ